MSTLAAPKVEESTNCRLVSTRAQSPPPGRMFLVTLEISKSQGGAPCAMLYAYPVVAIVTADVHHGTLFHTLGLSPGTPRDLQEAIELGWSFDAPEAETDVIVLDEDAGGLANKTERDYAHKIESKSLVLAAWPEEEDERRLERIARDLLCTRMRWSRTDLAELTAEFWISGRDHTPKPIPVPGVVSAPA